MNCDTDDQVLVENGKFEKMIVRCAVNKQAQQTGQELLDQVANAERERAAAPDEVPLGQWEAVRVRPDFDAALTSQALLASSEEAKDVLQACSTPHGMCLFYLCVEAVD